MIWASSQRFLNANTALDTKNYISRYTVSNDVHRRQIWRRAFNERAVNESQSTGQDNRNNKLTQIQ